LRASGEQYSSGGEIRGLIDASPGRVQTPWTISNTAAPANTITDVAAAPVKKPTAQSSARSRN
jgi:hypothetical protein